MTVSIVDDFSFIASRMREIRSENDIEDIEDDVCSHCEGGGWECYGLGHGDPHFRECSICRNPNGHQSP